MNPSLLPGRGTLLFAVAVLLLAAGLAMFALTIDHGEGPPRGSGEALVGGPFSLTDHTGRTVTDKDFQGRYMLVLFGFSSCPDICPTQLQVMMAAWSMLDARSAARLQPVFVTIDPERDTPQVMAAFVKRFGQGLVGLTGKPAEISAVARAYRVPYARTIETGSHPAPMDQSSIIYLMGRDGRFVKHFAYTTDARGLAAGLAEAMAASP